MSAATLAEMRAEREAAAERQEALKRKAAKRWRALRILVALGLILLAYHVGWQCGYLSK